MELFGLEQEYDRIAKELDKVSNDRRTVNDQFVPLKLKINEISRDYFKQRTDIYNEEMKNQKCSGNCFITGVDRFWVEGDGFKTEMKEGNNIFPEFQDNVFTNSGNQKDSKFIIEPERGKIHITRNSAYGDPLAFGMRSEGKFSLTNGNWELSADGKNIFGKPDNNGKYLALDIRIGYSTDTGDLRLYDFDVDAHYDREFSQAEKDQLSDDINQHKIELQQIQSRIDNLVGSNPDIRKINEQIEEVNQKLRKNDEEYSQVQRRIRITIDETTNPTERDKVVAQLRQKLSDLDKEYDQLKIEKRDLQNQPAYNQLSDLRREQEDVQYQIQDLSHILQKGSGQVSEAFGEVKLSDTQSINTGNGKISYEEFIQGFPVLKNTYVKSHTEGRASTSVVAGGRRLQTPYIVSDNMDILDIDVLRSQECIHTQYRMRFEYLKDTRDPDDISFTLSDGTTLNLGKWQRGKYRGQTFKDGKTQIQYKTTSDTQYINMVMAYMGGVRAHTENDPAGIRQGVIDESSPTVSNNFDIVNNVDDIKAGDVIIGSQGHGMAVKEVLEIPPDSGNKYIRIFAGSMPAIDPEIYKELVSFEHLKSDQASVHGYSVTGLLRWKN